MNQMDDSSGLGGGGEATMFRRQLPSSQQPLSLMTIDATLNRKPSSPTNNTNLLTIRILETSERKMQLLKKLLTPEEYNSIATDLFAGGDDIRAELASSQGAKVVQEHRHLTTSVHRHQFGDLGKTHVSSVPMHFDIIQTKQTESATDFARQLSKSESNIVSRFSAVAATTTSTNLHENLAKKREALEFFFKEPPERIPRNLGEDLAIELRSGHYLSVAEPEFEEKVIRSGSCSWLDRIEGFLGLIGLSLASFTSSWNDANDDGGGGTHEQAAAISPDGDELFFKYHEQFKCKPYTRRRNLEIACKRLKADHQFDKIQLKILSTSSESRANQEGTSDADQTNMDSRQAGCSNLIDLAKMQKSHALSSRKLLNAGQQQFRVVQAIGHFNMIHLAGPQKFNQMIQDKPMEMYYLSSNESRPSLLRRRRDLRELSLQPPRKQQNRRLRGSPRSQLKLNLLALKFKDHDLMLAEERVSFKLLEARDRMRTLKNELSVVSSRLTKLIETRANQLGQKTGGSLDDQSEVLTKSKLLSLLRRVSEMFELRLQTVINLKAAQDELLSISNELDSLRKEQGFNSTQIKVITKQLNSLGRGKSELIKRALGQLAQSIQSANHHNLSSAVDIPLDIHEYQKILDEEGKIWGDQQQFDVEVQEFGLHLTPDDECPSEEVQRRRDVQGFLKSLIVRLLVGDQYKYDCSIEADLFSLDLRENQLSLPLPLLPMATTTTTKTGDDNDFNNLDQQQQVGLKVVVYKKGCQFLPFSRRLIGIGESKMPLDFRAATTHSIWIKFGDGSDVNNSKKTKAQFEFSTAFIHHPPTAATRQEGDEQLVERQFQFERLVNSLFALTLTTNHRLDDLKTKLAKLANRVDTSLLLAWIAKPPPGKSAWGSYFVLDPFEVRFSPTQTAAESAQSHRQQVGESIQQQQQPTTRTPQMMSIRHALLVWRWVNNLGNQPIYLSERENVQAFGLQSTCGQEELRSNWLDKTTGICHSKASKLGGYKSIEQTRALAVEFLKRFELRLAEVLKFNTELELLAGSSASSMGGGASRSAARLADLLREPQLRMDFSNLVRAVRQMTPRLAANRPLMRKRRRHVFSAAAHTEELEQWAAARTLDLEGQVFSRWQRLASVHKSALGGAGLQLVVTIQQATNVPMRVVSSLQQQTRPNSPSFLQQQHHRQQQHFQQTGATSPTTSFLSLVQQAGSSAVQAPQSNYALAPPTTYVEIVFQRRQQASSLSQGKNPSWNETLFFPVDVARFQPTVEGSLGEFAGQSGHICTSQQLIDEFLQLNLYDYNCYLQADNAGGVVGSSMFPTMPTTSLQDQTDWISGAGLQSARPPSMAGDLSGTILGGSRVLASRQRVERHLLGSLQVPLTTLLSSGRIEGSFALSRPLLLDNYQFERDRPLLSSMALGGDSGDNRQGASSQLGARAPRSADCETHISLFITLDPAPVPFPFQLYLPIGAYESQAVFGYTRFWEQVVSQHRNYANPKRKSQATGGRSFRSASSGRLQPNRHIRALVLHQDAKYCLASRLLTPLRPPREWLAQVRERSLVESGAAAEQQQQIVLDEMRALARFVSLLSPLKYGLLSMRQLASSGLWFDSWQLVNKSLGGPEEKATLMASYFLHLGKCSAILLGDAIPEGRCVYVIVWHENESRFIEDQLQLQAMELLSGGRQQTNGTLASDGHQAPVEQQQFISRLPILISSRSIQLWDPVSGKAYWLSDQLPLISVGSIITMENVYANIQSVEQPSETNYDIRSKSFWFPLFETSSVAGQTKAPNLAGLTAATAANRQHQLASMRAAFDKKRAQQMSWRRQLSRLELMRKSIGRPPMGPVLCEGSVEFDYEQLSELQCRELRDSIEQAVKAHLFKWRPNRPTYFNRTLSRLLDEKLALCERLCLANLSGSTNDGSQANELRQDWRTQLADLIRNELLVAHLSSPSGLGSRKVISWPMNLPYTSMKSILDSLFASGIHNADLILAEPAEASKSRCSSTQFLVACHVHAYPAKVASVWLYVAALLTSPRESQRLLLA